MAHLRCPTCGASGELAHAPAAFAIVGDWPDAGRTIACCAACEGGLVVWRRPGPLGGRLDAAPIAAPSWRRLGHAAPDREVVAAQPA